MKFERREPLFPRFEGQLSITSPCGMDKVYPTREQKEFLEGQALDIFTVCSNAGLPFREALMSILITGMDWGVNVNKF